MNQRRDSHPSLSLLITLFSVFVAISADLQPAFARSADEMPPPKAAPRYPVSREKLFEDAVTPPPKTRAGSASTRTAKGEMAGTAQALDGASLRLGSTELRLAGLIVAPVTEPSGMAARTTLDQLIEGQSLNCVRRDKERDGRLLVSCTRGDGSDLAAEMLRAGAALYSRSAMLPDDITTTYRVAENEAQHAKRGLWTNVPAGGQGNRMVSSSQSAVPTPAPTQPVVTANPSPIKMVPITETAVAQALAQPSTPPVTTPIAAPVTEKIPSATPTKAATMITPATDSATSFGTFVMAFGLITFMLMGLAFFDFLQRRRVRFNHELDVRHNRQIVAAALAGELAAARDVCESRLHNMASGGEARWPRLRSFVYQTHVDKIGLLGPYLARQIATIYGQMADVSGGREDLPYRNSESLNRTTVTKTLDRLCGHMDVALEGLSFVEMSGDVFLPSYSDSYNEDEQRQLANTAKPAPEKLRTPLKSIIARNRLLPRPEHSLGRNDDGAAHKNNARPEHDEAPLPKAERTTSRTAAPTAKEAASRPVTKKTVDEAEEIARKTFHETALQQSVKSHIAEMIEEPIRVKAKATKAEKADKPARTSRPRSNPMARAPLAAAATEPTTAAPKPTKANNPFIHDFDDVQGNLLTLDDDDDFIQQRAG